MLSVNSSSCSGRHFVQHFNMSKLFEKILFYSFFEYSWWYSQILPNRTTEARLHLVWWTGVPCSPSLDLFDRQALVSYLISAGFNASRRGGGWLNELYTFLIHHSWSLFTINIIYHYLLYVLGQLIFESRDKLFWEALNFKVFYLEEVFIWYLPFPI